ncbi:MAG: hypothetical protein JRM80_06645 [Nitrososphaerota archaeon]|nr:hypothetical protein [Nitrososphaerota archaeon]
MQNETLTNVFWGLFLIWFGVLWAHLGSDPFDVVDSPLFALGTGLLLLLLNLARSTMRLKLSILTAGLGILLTVVYTPIIFFGINVPFLPALLVIVGLALIVGAFRSNKYP